MRSMNKIKGGNYTNTIDKLHGNPINKEKLKVKSEKEVNRERTGVEATEINK